MLKISEFKAKVSKVREFFYNGKLFTKILSLDVPPKANFSFKAGQFAMVSVNAVKNPENPKLLKWGAFSIPSAPFEKNRLELIVGIKPYPGLTNFLGSNAIEGSSINLKGPYGHFFLDEKAKEYVFVAIGTGIAPIMSFIRTLSLKNSPKKIALFYGVRGNNLYYYREELEKISKENPNFKLNAVCGKGEDSSWNGKIGFVQDLLKNYSFSIDKKGIAAYVCGNPQMVSDVGALLQKKGLLKENIHFEQW